MLPAQAHDHASQAAAPRDARLDLLLGGPHVILYHHGYLALGDEQVAGLQPLERAVCAAEQVYVEQSVQWRSGLDELLGDSALLCAQRPSFDTTPPARLHDAMMQRARAESQWLTVLLQTRRDALKLLTPVQRTQLSGLQVPLGARNAVAMISGAATRSAQPPRHMDPDFACLGMVVSETTLLPYCEVRGPSSHFSVPPLR